MTTCRSDQAAALPREILLTIVVEDRARCSGRCPHLGGGVFDKRCALFDCQLGRDRHGSGSIVVLGSARRCAACVAAGEG